MKGLFRILLWGFLPFSAWTQSLERDSLQQALSLAQGDEERVMILSNLSYEYIGTDMDSALLLAQEAHDLALKINFKPGLARALFHLGHAYRILSDIPKSMRASLQGLQLAEENGFRHAAALCNYNIGALYLDLLNDYPKALAYFRKAEQWNSPVQDALGESIQLTIDVNLGIVYERLNRLDSAAFYYEDVLAHIDINPRLRPALSNFNGLLQVKLKNYQEALTLFRQAGASAFDHRTFAEVFFNLASCFREMGRIDSCKFYANRSLAEAEQIGYQQYVLKDATLLAEIYESENNPEAFRFYKTAKLANDKVYGEQKVQDLQRIITGEMQRQQETEREKTAYENRVRQLSLLGGLAVVLLVTFLLYRNNRQKQKSNAQLLAQNRALEIEAALERIRAKALAMHKSPEIKDVAAVMRNEILGLGLEGISAATIWLEQPNGKIRAWDFTVFGDTSLDQGVKVDVEFDPKLAPPRAHFHKIWNRRGNYWVGESNLEDLYESVNWLKTQDEAAAIEMLHLLDSGKLKYWWHPTTVLEKGRLNVDFVLPPPEEMATILPKMAAVFDLAYRRFEDLQKAEAQVREAQIETALERVRARTMAMHKSEELSELVLLMYKEIEPFGVSALGISIAIFREEENAIEYWFADHLDSNLLQSYKVAGRKNKVFGQIWEAWKNKIPQTQVYLEGKEKWDYDSFILEETEFRKLPDELKKDIRTHKTVCFTFTIFKYGYLESIDLTIPKEEDTGVLIRFAKVFEQAYTRFLDLQKAEAQAREAQVEAALERVRSRTMAMHKSEELAEVVAVIYQEVGKLGLADWGCNIQIFNDQENTAEIWISENLHDLLPKPYYFRDVKHPDLLVQWEAWRKKNHQYTLSLKGESKKSYDDYVLTHTDFKLFPDEMKRGIRSIDQVHFNMAWMQYGFIVSINTVAALDKTQFDILSRFAKVFEQTYTRFLDLQNAEAQAREAQIEAALERVRSRTMAMHKTDELRSVIHTVFEQVKTLGFDATACGLTLFNKEDKSMTMWLAGFDTDAYPESYLVPYFDHPYYHAQFEAWENGQAYRVFKFEGELKKSYDRLIFEHGDLKRLPASAKEAILSIETASNCTAFMKYGMFESVMIGDEVLSEQQANTLQRFAKVFEQTYTRFLDLKKAEVQAREAQIEVSLERIRARAMAMRTSEELLEVATVLYKELHSLGVTSFLNCGYVEVDEVNQIQHGWLTSPDGSTMERFALPLTGEPAFDARYTAWKRQEPCFHQVVGGPMLQKHIEFAMPHFGSEQVAQMVNARFTDPTIFYCGNFPSGYLHLVSGTLLTAEEESLFIRFTRVFEMTYSRFLDLKRAEAQAREAQIEAALERVRASMMAMHKTEDLHEVLGAIFTQLQSLGFDAPGSALIIYNQERAAEHWMTGFSGGQFPESYKIPYVEHPYFTDLFHAWQKGVPFQEFIFEGNLKIEYGKWCLENSDFKRMPPEFKKEMVTPDRMVISDAFNKYGMIEILGPESLSEDSIGVLIRFSKVFEQTYTRFLDLQKAEAQAREAQIEAALERVRSRTMAMHKSEELGETIFILFNQLKELNILLELNWISLMDPEQNRIEIWITRGEGVAKPSTVHASDFLVFERNIEAWKQGQGTTTPVPKEKAKEVIRKFFHLDIDLPANADHFLVINFWHQFGFIGVGTFEEIKEEERQVIKRFAKVFEQTYTRFLDLQKAEAQAREAKIEAALERVRSRAIAMRQSDELSEAAELLYQEFLKMGVESFSCGYLINDDENREWKIWLTNPGEPFFKEFWTVPYHADHNLKARYESWKSKKEFHCAVLEGEENRTHHVVISKYAPWKEAMLETLPPRLVFNSAHFSLGHLLVISPDRLAPELEQAMVRFAKVFDLTWRRFLDLQKAEARAREARIEGGLDRLRAEIASMRNTDDLERITPLVWRELTNLEVPFFRCGVFIMDEEKEIVHTYLSTPEGKSLGLLQLPFDETDIARKTVSHWRRQEAYRDNWDRQQFTEWVQSLMDQGYIRESQSYQGADQPPEKLALHFVPFKQGMLYVGNSEQLSTEQLTLVKRLADGFAVAYARYEDFNRLEEAKGVVEKTLNELKATQSQLIQSEKMASLGELTAGIAHEIQNPLNFVNNFSDISNELVHEMQLELDRGKIEDAKAIAVDIKQNLEKILHHGKRADGIVKGMLQHSRNSSGQKEPTDLNALCDEYLRLAYHGLRAKDKVFNAEYKTELDPSLPRVKVVPQEIGRVLLNLINNAFQAVADANHPLVVLSTRKLEGQIEIRVSDNGHGIPDHIKDKIFQPFFTTKPTGQGTGLGLSLSYDIVKAHGGELKVESRDGKGTIFKIVLNLS